MYESRDTSVVRTKRRRLHCISLQSIPDVDCGDPGHPPAK